MKDKNKKCLHFDGVEIPPHKNPSDKVANLELHRATVSEEMEVLSPELQQVAKATPAPVPVVASDQPSRLNARTVTIEDVPIPFSPFSATDCTMLNYFSFEDFVAVAFPDLARDLDIQI